MYGTELATRVARGLQDYYLARSGSGPNGLGLWCDRIVGLYFLQPFTNGAPSGSPVLEFQGRDAFVAWLARQSDESLASLDPDVAAPRHLSLSAIEDFVSHLDDPMMRYLYYGPYFRTHPFTGENCPVPPAYAACMRRDPGMLRRVIPATTKAERQRQAFDGKSALTVACELGFVEGAKLLVREDGFCCSLGSHCPCLVAAAQSSSPCLEQFRARNFQEKDFILAVPDWLKARLRRKALDTLGISRWTHPHYLIDRIRREERYGSHTLEADIAEELAVFPELELDRPDRAGHRVLLSYLSTPHFQHQTFLRLYKGGAELHARTPEGLTALDLLLLDGRELSPDQRRTRDVLVAARVPTSVAGPLTRMKLWMVRLLRRESASR
jgi:hypothetical protein